MGRGGYPARAGGPWLCSTLVLFLFHARRRPVRVDDQGPAPAVNHDLVVERAQQHAVLHRRLAAVGLVLRMVHLARARRAGCSRRPTGSAGPAAAPRCGSPPGPSRRTRCPAAGSARPAGRRAAGGAGSWPARPGRTAGRRPCRSRLVPGRPGPRWCRAGASPPWRSLSSSTQSRTRSSSASTLTSPVTTGAIAASHAIAAAASPSSHAPSHAPVSAACARRAAHRARTCSVHWSCRAESPSSSIRSAREMCAQALTGCPARSGSSPAAVSRRIASASASWYRCPWVRSSSFPAGAASASSTAATAAAHPAVRSPCRTPGPADGGGQLHLPVGELPARILIGQIPAGPHVHLGEQRRQVRQPQPAGEGGQQLLITRVPVLLRQLAGPQADHPPRGLRDLPGGQRRQHPRMRGGPLSPRGVPDGGAPGDPGPVHQPGHRAVVPVPGVAPARR